MRTTNKSGLFGLNKGSCCSYTSLYNRGVLKNCPLEWVSLLTNHDFLGFPDVEDIKMVKVQRLHREDQQKREEETLKRKQEKEAHF